MTRKLLKDLGLEEDAINAIMKENGSDIEDAKEKIKLKLEADAERETIKLNKTIKDLEKKLDDVPDGSEWETKYNQAIKDHQKALDEKETALRKLEQDLNLEKNDKLNNQKDIVLTDALISAGADAKIAKLLKAQFKLDTLELDDTGKIKDLENILKPVKESFPDAFAVVEKAGFKPNNPVTQGNAKQAFTMEQIRNMKPHEINANWDNGLKEAIEKGE